MKYRPVNVLPADWNQVKDFCRRAVLTYGPPSATIATELLSTTTLFVLWATKEEHAPLDYDSIFHPSLMGRYLRSRVSDKKSSAFKSLRSRLFRVGSAVSTVDHHKTKRGTVFVPVHEYTARELAELEGWAATQNTAERRRYAFITLALMGGAGLSMSEALGVRGIDIHRDIAGYAVTVVGSRARTVPLHSDWAHYLDEPSTHFVGDEHVLFNGQTPRGRATTLRKLYCGPHPAPNPQWLRDTWMLQLVRTLPLSVIMQAVGTSDVVRFRRYFDTAHLDFAQWHDAVRNPAAYAVGMDDTSDRQYHEGVWADSPTKLRDGVEPVNEKLGDTPHPEGRPRPRDRARGNDYQRRAQRKPNEQTLTTDSTAFPTGALAVPFKRITPSEQHNDGDRQPVNGEEHEPRRIEALEAEWTPKRPRKKSRYVALPPGSTYLAAAPDDPTAAVSEDRTDSAASRFDALRAELLAEARRSARGGKR